MIDTATRTAIRIALLLPALVCAGGASAQWAGQSVAIAESAGANSSLFPGQFPGVSVTPTMRRQKLDQATALRVEAARLQAEDGGTLSAEHAAYVRKRVRKILDGRAASAPIGSLIARR